MRITFLPGAFATPDEGTAVDIDAGKFLDELGSAEGSASVECADKAAKLRGLGFVLAQYQDGATSKELRYLDPTSTTDLLAYDVDDITRAQLDAAWPTWSRFDAAVYSTMKHTAEAPRVRLLVRLSRPIANGSGDDYVRLYHAVARLLGIPFDASTKDRARFFFAPQHMPGKLADQWRFRFNGARLPVEAVLAAVDSGELPAAKGGAAPLSGGAAAGPRRLPPVAEFKRLADRWLRSSAPEAVATGSVLEQVLAKRPFAEVGGIHLASRDLAFALVRDVALFDGDGFAGTYLEPCWDVMPGAGVDERLRNWQALVSSAETKLEAGRVEQAAAKAMYAPAAVGELTEAQKAAAGALRGALVCEHKGNYYVYDARRGRYLGPVKGTGLGAACRSGLMGVPDFEFRTWGKNGAPALKAGPQLVTEYGFCLEGVNYWAMPPAELFDETHRSINIPAYQWNDWAPRRHECADELLRAVGGEQYGRLEAWMGKLTDLRQPLPALVLVGPRGTWKSRIAQILSRFWGSAAAGSPSKATQVLGRFSRPLLDNPVVHTDEIMARAENGRAIPEIYRESISSTVHTVEAKGVDPVTLHTALRHVIAVNDLDQVFGGEVDATSVEATVERYLVVPTRAGPMAEFETRWAGTVELDALREGTPLLEHVAWLAQTSTYVGTCRLWVDTGTDRDTLMRARFSDDTLTVLVNIGIAALLGETGASHPGQLHRLPLVLGEDGLLRYSPTRAIEAWPTSSLTVGSQLRKPTSAKAGKLLNKAGFKADPLERASNSKWKAWVVDHELLKAFLAVEDTYTWDEIGCACEMVWGRRPR